MRAVGKRSALAVACVVALLTLLVTPVGLSYAEEPAPAAAACPPSPAVLASGTGQGTTLLGATTSRSSSTSASPYQPSAGEVVACVGSQEIDGATFAHWAIVAEKAQPRAHRRQGAEPTRGEMTITMGFLISADWLIGEAAHLHIEPSAAEVRRLFARLRQQQFHKPAQFEKFLRHSGETVSDLLLRVRLSILSTRIQQRVEGHGSKRSRQRAFTHFLRRFQRRWEAQTYCETLYKVHACGHTARSL
jgi:hypothetical protein